MSRRMLSRWIFCSVLACAGLLVALPAQQAEARHWRGWHWGHVHYHYRHRYYRPFYRTHYRYRYYPRYRYHYYPRVRFYWSSYSYPRYHYYPRYINFHIGYRYPTYCSTTHVIQQPVVYTSAVQKQSVQKAPLQKSPTQKPPAQKDDDYTPPKPAGVDGSGDFGLQAFNIGGQSTLGKLVVLKQESESTPSSGDLLARDRARKYVGYGDDFFARGDYAAAASRYRSAISAAPSLAEAHLRRAVCAIANGNYEQASKSFDEAVRRDERVLHSEFRLDKVYKNDADKQSHLNALVQRTLQNRDSVELMRLVGMFLYFDGQADRSQKFFAHAKKLNSARIAREAREDRRQASRPQRGLEL